MAGTNFIQFKYCGVIPDGKRTATALGNELQRLVGSINLISPSVNISAYGSILSTLLSPADFRYITRSDVMLKISTHGYTFPDTPSNKNICTIVYNAYYADSALRETLSNPNWASHYANGYTKLKLNNQ